jgi:hypothetical protein
MKTLWILGGILLMLSCNSNKNDSYIAAVTEVETTITDPEHPGKALMEKYCYACHNATATGENRLAPPMIAVKKHYLGEETTKEEFTEALLNWTREPSEDKARMYGAVQRFGVMPYQSFPEETIRQISEYIYDYEIEEPVWFKDHFQGGKGMNKGMKGHGNCGGNCSGNCKGMNMKKGQGMGTSEG